MPSPCIVEFNWSNLVRPHGSSTTLETDLIQSRSWNCRSFLSPLLPVKGPWLNEWYLPGTTAYGPTTDPVRNLTSTVSYYIDMIFLLGNIPCVRLTLNYIRNPSGIFSIPSLTPFPLWYGSKLQESVLHVIIRKLHGGLKIWILFSTLENNIHIFATFICMCRFIIQSL